MSVREQSAHRVLPIPKDFPVTWEAPEDERLLWELQAQHMPGQQLRLTFDIMGTRTTAGLSYAFARLEFPIRGVEARLFNTYAYRANVPVKAPPASSACRLDRFSKRVCWIRDAYVADPAQTNPLVRSRSASRRVPARAGRRFA